MDITSYSIENQINEIISFVNQKCDRDLLSYDEKFVVSIINSRITTLGLNDLSLYYEYIRKNELETELLIKALNVSFSLFFREPLVYDLLAERILPKISSLKQNGNEIRAWSAGCAYGEEAYSLAILLDDLLEFKKETQNYRIFATDISYEALEQALIGEYDANKLQNAKLKYLDKYFCGNANRKTIKMDLKKHINFGYYDMLDKQTTNPTESIYGNFDLVSCCNLLIYYKSESRYMIIDKLWKSICDKGYLITSSAEMVLIEKTINIKPLYPSFPIFQKIKSVLPKNI